MLKGLKIINDSSKVKEDKNNELISKKRTNSEIDENAQKIEKKIVEKKNKDQNIDFTEIISFGVDSFFQDKSEGVKKSFEKLEIYKNMSSNIKNLLNNNLLENVEEQVNVEELENISDDDQNYITGKVKKEYANMLQFENFQKSHKTQQKKEISEVIESEDRNIKRSDIEDDKKEKKLSKKKIITLSNCLKCFGSSLNPHSIISSSDTIYVAYPFHEGSISRFHLKISSKDHVNSSASLQENEYTELRNYMKSIVSFNAANDKLTVFLEYALDSNEVSHFHIDAIPLKFSLLQNLRMFFKKALMEQDEEWTSNKNIVDTTKYKGNVSKILSDKFSYVHVDFNAEGGFLHVVEDKRRFSNTFLKEILASFLKMEVTEIKYPRLLSSKEVIDIVEEYKKEFNYYDWTNYVN